MTVTRNHGTHPVTLTIDRPGRVTLAGAGPGAADLLTLKTAERIRSADAIVFDALVSPEIRAMFPEAARQYPVGKRAGDARSCSQADINALLACLARQGLEVLRLKGGDPYVFGRGGEEALYLQQRGIAVEVLPAVSAVNGAAATAGIPLTHRAVSRSFTVLAGEQHLLDETDWPALVALGGTWVFLMAKTTVRELARRLIAAGASPGLPLALVENATMADQVARHSTLSVAASSGIVPTTAGPGLVIVGETVGLGIHVNGTEATYAGVVSDLYEPGAVQRADRGWR